MSSQLGKVVSLILLERFGVVVEKVGTCLFQYGSAPLLHIKKRTELPLSKVKESLTILIKYQLVTFVPNQNENLANYIIKPEKVLLMLRYPKYINLIKKKFGDTSEMIIEEYLQRSYIIASEALLKVNERLSKNNENTVSFAQLKNEFLTLINAKYLIRLPQNTQEEKPVPVIVLDDKDVDVQLPLIDVNLFLRAQSGEQVVFPDKDIYWQINFDRFHQDMRDKSIFTAFAKKFDENAGEFVKILLQQMYIRTQPWADISNPVPILEIKDVARKQKNLNQLNAFFDQYVSVIEQDSSNLIRKSGEASGGSFQIYLKEVYTEFAWEIVEQCVMEKFDSKAARIFRLVKLKRCIEPDMIQQLAMIPAKEAKRLTYQLLEENFLQIQELRKPAVGGSGPNKSFTLFHINLNLVVRMILELCYKTLYNVMIRRNHEKFTNKRIIEKKQRVDTIALGMRAQGAEEEQLAEIEEMITPPEKEILEKIEKGMKKLNTVELEIDDSIFLLKLFLMYSV
ncbi:DNA-directed RNA polymerase III subunit RPC3 isoform X1 [Diorhabda sublineata]|uniref:DNA-directed RNA polymerase III subunit RPC3 isoform X1 n=2 Tax=Diorhabda sublineata TaxID=1163346 RepID=UPI0024E12385|nr:DNA-directed RNA polymerase III subunit RPC3 isoform X1 [Diorhabda sublineata]